MSMLPIDLVRAERGLSDVLLRQADIPVFGPYLPPGSGMRTLSCGGAGRFSWEPHVHAEHELFWGVRGSAIVLTPGRYWVLPLGMGLWVPAGIPHGLYIGQDTTLSCTLIGVHMQPRWDAVRSLCVPPAAAELLNLHAFSALPTGMRRRVERMVLDLLALETTPTIDLPMPADMRLIRVVQGVLADLADDRPLSDWSAVAAMSERNFTRRFRAETGLSFRDWRTLARMRLAMALLAEGQPLPRIAAQAGYGTISAFVSAFRRVVGHTPGRHGAGQAIWPVGDMDWPHGAGLRH